MTSGCQELQGTADNLFRCNLPLPCPCAVPCAACGERRGFSHTGLSVLAKFSYLGPLCRPCMRKTFEGCAMATPYRTPCTSCGDVFCGYKMSIAGTYKYYPICSSCYEDLWFNE